MILAEFYCEDRSSSSGEVMHLQMPLAGDDIRNDSASSVSGNFHDLQSCCHSAVNLLQLCWIRILRPESGRIMCFFKGTELDQDSHFQFQTG